MMSTRCMVSIFGVTEEQAERGFRAAFDVFERVERVMNEWKPDSPLSAINRAAGSGRFVAAPPDLCAVLRASIDGARRTDGLFDPTWAALRTVWRFGTDRTDVVPDGEAVKKACALVSYRALDIQPSADGCLVKLEKRGMALGLGGIAKGWAVDRAVDALRKLGFRDFLVQAGGDLYAAGKRGDRPWRVGIRDPRGPVDSVIAELDVTDAAFSTSGDYERFFIHEGKRFHHLIDPRTCHPAEASRSATVLARRALDAEILTKATFILGGEAAVRLAREWEAGVVLVTADGGVVVSPELMPRITIHPRRAR